MKIIAETKDKEGFWSVQCPKRTEKVKHAGPSWSDMGKVPVYVCIGSHMKRTETCPHMETGTTGVIGAEIECLWPEEREELSCP